MRKEGQGGRRDKEEGGTKRKERGGGRREGEGGMKKEGQGGRMDHWSWRKDGLEGRSNEESEKMKNEKVAQGHIVDPRGLVL